MELLKKEAGVIELTIRGDCYGKQSQMQTDYNYELVIDPLLNKPAFVLNVEAQIIFSQEDYVVFKSYVIYIFDHTEGQLWGGHELHEVAKDGRNCMNTLLHSRLNPLRIARQLDLPEPDEATETSTLEQLLAVGLRLN